MSGIKPIINQMTVIEREILSIIVYGLIEVKTEDGKIILSTATIQAINKVLDKSKPTGSSGLSNIGTDLVEAIQDAIDKDNANVIRTDVRAIETSRKVKEQIRKHSTLTVKQNMVYDAVYNRIKGKAITLISRFGGISLEELRTALQKLIVDQGVITGYYERWTYDLYSQYRRIAANEVRKKLGLRFAIYEGGTIETTREHCDKYAGKVLHESEIAEWNDESWTWKGKPESGYNSFTDAGGYNCRHRWRWITDGLAKQLLIAEGEFERLQKYFGIDMPVQNNIVKTIAPTIDLPVTPEPKLVEVTKKEKGIINRFFKGLIAIFSKKDNGKQIVDKLKEIQDLL